MKYLLDVNVLLAGLWKNHSRHAETAAWIKGKDLVLCPLAELGFLRISTNKKAINAPMEKARELLSLFAAGRIADDLPALDSKPDLSEEVTDHYLADLAAKHGYKLATFDESIDHDAVEIITKPPGPAPTQPGN